MNGGLVYSTCTYIIIVRRYTPVCKGSLTAWRRPGSRISFCIVLRLSAQRHIGKKEAQHRLERRLCGVGQNSLARVKMSNLKVIWVLT